MKGQSALPYIIALGPTLLLQSWRLGCVNPQNVDNAGELLTVGYRETRN